MITVGASRSHPINDGLRPSIDREIQRPTTAGLRQLIVPWRFLAADLPYSPAAQNVRPVSVVRRRRNTFRLHRASKHAWRGGGAGLPVSRKAPDPPPAQNHDVGAISFSLRRLPVASRPLRCCGVAGKSSGPKSKCAIVAAANSRKRNGPCASSASSPFISETRNAHRLSPRLECAADRAASCPSRKGDPCQKRCSE